jgi:hypothetical protein
MLLMHICFTKAHECWHCLWEIKARQPGTSSSLMLTLKEFFRMAMIQIIELKIWMSLDVVQDK